jgi:Domain of unknown function (DUF4382)/Domain of unknown function (DUF5666)
MKQVNQLTALCAMISIVTLTTVTGCGGGSGSNNNNNGGNPPPSGTRARVSLLATDSFREDFDHVWATILKVELIPATGDAISLFDDPAGRQLDLKTLRDATGGRFAFLGDKTVAAGNYTGLRVTLGPNAQMFEHAKAIGKPIPLDSTVVTLNFAAPKALGTTADQLIVDFDLANFKLVGGKITVALKEGTKAGLTDPSRHEDDDYRGTISGLSGTAPTQTFTLDRGLGQTVNVAATAATAIFGNGGALADGKVVEVTGIYNATTNKLVATKIETEDGSNGHTESDGVRKAKVRGGVTLIDAVAGTFTISHTHAKGCMPSSVTVKIKTSASTTYRTLGGRVKTPAEFFVLLAATPIAEAQGTFDAATNTLTATSVKIKDSVGNGGNSGWENESHHDQDDKNGDGKVDSNDDHGSGGGGSDDKGGNDDKGGSGKGGGK